MMSNWLAAYALGAGFATPESPDAIETIAGIAAGDADLLLAARRAVMRHAAVDDDTRTQALRLLELAIGRLADAAPRGRGSACDAISLLGQNSDLGRAS